MGPIVQLGMGLAVGSPFMVVRVGLRIGLSIVVAIGGSALLTRSLPFRELTTEIAARTTPTVLDLVTAAFCAATAVYATMRPVVRRRVDGGASCAASPPRRRVSRCSRWQTPARSPVSSSRCAAHPLRRRSRR
jgi:uncharacterized membrane protein